MLINEQNVKAGRYRVVKDNSCLKFREPLRKLCFLICIVTCITIIFVNLSKAMR